MGRNRPRLERTKNEFPYHLPTSAGFDQHSSIICSGGFDGIPGVLLADELDRIPVPVSLNKTTCWRTYENVGAAMLTVTKLGNL